MSKSVTKTPEIEASIRSAIGDPNADVSRFVVFEANAVTTLPLRKQGFYKGGRISPGVLSEMADLVNTPGEAIPMHVMHLSQDQLPIGRVFQSKVVANPLNGESELKALFYIPNTDPEKQKYISDIETSVTDEVSVSILTKHATCSECGWDYYSDEASFMNFFDLTCENGHTIGENGVHIRLNGLDKWFELSLVNRGGAQNAKILARAKQSLGTDGLEKMAASGTNLDARILTLTSHLDNPSKEEDMDLKLAVDKIAELSASEATAKTKLEGLTSEVVTLRADITTKDAEITRLKADAGTHAELKAQIDTQKADNDALIVKLTEHVTAALTAAGEEVKDLPKDAAGLLKLVEDKGLKLHQMVGAGQGGKSNGGKSDADLKLSDEQATARRKAFKTN